jgi:hypothetical protein
MQGDIDPVTRLGNLMNGLAEECLHMSDEEIREDLREEGLDPDIEAEKTRQTLLDALRNA